MYFWIKYFVVLEDTIPKKCIVSEYLDTSCANISVGEATLLLLVGCNGITCALPPVYTRDKEQVYFAYAYCESVLHDGYC